MIPTKNSLTNAESSRSKVLGAILDFITAMRTAPRSSPDEAVEWATLEQEFTNRKSNESQPA